MLVTHKTQTHKMLHSTFYRINDMHKSCAYHLFYKKLDANVTFGTILKWLTLGSLIWLWDNMTHFDSLSLSAFSHSANMNFVRHGGLGLQCNHEKMSMIYTIESICNLCLSLPQTHNN